MKFKKLFSPIKIRGLELKNRIVFPAMGTKMAEEDGFINDKIINYHVERAKGGNGLNMLEVSCVHGPSAPKDFVSISDDKYIPKLKELVDRVHEEDGKIGIQLWQGGIAVMGDPNAEIFVPSDTINMLGEEVEGASIEKIEEVILSYGKAARRAVKAGFDTIEIHAGHNYSPHMFLSSAFNKREDEYGGSLENRSRYLINIIKEVRKNIPEDMPLFMRIVAHDDYLEDGLSIQDMIAVSKRSKDVGIDVLNISRGNIVTDAIKYEVPPIDIEKGFNVENAEIFKDETEMIVQAVGRINDPEQAEEILNRNKVDLITIGRGQLADAFFAKKASEGKEEDIIKCIGCNQGCYDGFVDESVDHITCLRNPAVGREEEYVVIETENPERIGVVGGGMAGLEAAILLKEKGHEPIIYEKTNSLGGQLVLAGVAPRKEEMREAALSRASQAERMGIDIRKNTSFQLENIKADKIDTVIIANGSSPIELKLSGTDQENVFLSHDILSGKKIAKGRIAIIGGGLVGLEIAELLGADPNNEITVMERLDKVAGDLGSLRRITVMESLDKLGVDIKTSVDCKEIKGESLVYDEEGEEKHLDIDYVIMAVGSSSNDSKKIKDYCDNNNIPYYVIGDAQRARRALDAIKEATDLALFKID